MYLTNRQVQISNLIYDGQSNKEIALKLGISVPTVKNHIVEIYKKYDVGSSRELMKKLRDIDPLNFHG